jgi:beta-glucosidase
MPGVAHGPGGKVSDESYPGEGSTPVAFDTVLKRAILNGKVPQARLDDMVRRILRTMIGRGLFDQRQRASFDVQAHRAVARKVSAHSLTLLKNDVGVLPLGQLRSLVLVGADADHRTASGGASVVARATASISTLEGLRAACAQRGVHFAYTPGADHVGPASMLGGPEAIPSSCFQTERGGGSPGLQATYVVGSAAPVQRIDAQILMDAGFLSQLMNAAAVPPPPGGFGEHLKVRWTGWLVPPAAGDYRLSLTCMGSARLLLEGHELLRVDASPTPVTAISERIALSTDHPLAIEVHYETTAHANWLELGDVILGWEPPDGALPPAVSEAARLAADSDAAIVFVHPYESEQRDRATLSLPNGQDRLVRAIAAVNPRTIVVVSSGGPILTPWLNDIAALIQVYHPGQEGGDVLAAALFGEINPSGRLPVTWPASEADVPVSRPNSDGSPTTITERTAVGYRGYAANGTVPAFAFGHGLGYADFAHANLRIAGSPGPGQGINVLVDVENLGDRDGEDVVQIYQRVPRDRGNFHRLVGFTRIVVPARAQRTAHIAISPRDLAFWSEVLGRFAVPTGPLELSLGRSALDLTLHASIEIGTVVPA